MFFVAVCLFFSVTTDAFASERNLLNLLRQSAPILIVAVAMTFVITTGGIDLSVGSTLALVNALAAIAIAAGIPWPLVVVMMVLVGALIGVANGYFTAYEAIPAFIVTLATLSAIRGLALLLTKGFSIPIPRDIGFVELGRGWVYGIPLPAWIAAGVALAGLLVAWLGVRTVRGLPIPDVPRLDQVGLDSGVLGFTAVVSVVVALGFGLIPALRASSPKLSDSLNEKDVEVVHV